MKEIDINYWNRKEHFEFFSKMASPFFGITTEVNCTICFRAAREKGRSFFASYLHKSMIAVNSIEELKYRIVDDKVLCFDTIHAGATVVRDDGTFAFVFIPFSHDFRAFNAALQGEIEAVRRSSGLRLNDDDVKKDLVRHSTFPWHTFTGLLHPTNFNHKDTVPRITFGKFSTRNDEKMLPVSIEAHHGLVDGFHIAKYLDEFQRQLDRP